MNSKIRKCECGGTSFVKLKMGGRIFQLQWVSKVTLWKGSGFKPDIQACKTCGKILFFVPDSQSNALEDED